MKYKEVISTKLSRLEADLTMLKYYLNRNEGYEAYKAITTLTEKVQDIQTLLNSETQD